MAITQSTEYAAQVASASNFTGRIDDGRKVGGEVQYAFATCTWAGDEAATEVVDLIELPAGAQVLPELSDIIVSTDCAGTLTVDVGDGDDPDRYCDGANAGAVGKIAFTSAAIPAAVATRYDVAGDNTVIKATWATLATPAAGTIHFSIAYKCLG